MKQLYDMRGKGPKLGELMLGWGDQEYLGLERDRWHFARKRWHQKRASQVEVTDSAKVQSVGEKGLFREEGTAPAACHFDGLTHPGEACLWGFKMTAFQK